MQQRTLRTGRVIDTAGRPLADAFVSVIWGTVAMPEIARRTDANGAFHVGLPPGRFRLQAVAAKAIGVVEVEGGAGDEIIIQVK